MFIEQFISKIKSRPNGFYRFLYNLGYFIRTFRIPFIKPIAAVLYYERMFRHTAWITFKKVFYYEPILRYRCESIGENLRLESTPPLIMGYGRIIMGSHVHFSDGVNLIVGGKVYDDPILTIGDNSYIGYRNIISCFKSVTIGNNCLLAEGVKIYDNVSHPLDPEARRRREPPTKENVSPVVIEDDVWIGSDCIILKGVRVGRGSVIGAGSVVTNDVPPFTVAVGNPAKVIKEVGKQ
ncbi:MAG: acyltransferase [Candidatus Omnitrophota bacterium]